MSNFLVVGVYRGSYQLYRKVVYASDPWHAEYLAEADGGDLVICAVIQGCACGRIESNG